MSWHITREQLAAWCRAIVAKYPKHDVDLFIIKLSGTQTARVRL